ncbi:MAG: hypothetical protein O7B81_06315, partial [Gammaproteobacteria bacterium]|nr:hypothetical protein [Gammaproteobacteria bacterium]
MLKAIEAEPWSYTLVDAKTNTGTGSSVYERELPLQSKVEIEHLPFFQGSCFLLQVFPPTDPRLTVVRREVAIDNE